MTNQSGPTVPQSPVKDWPSVEDWLRENFPKADFDKLEISAHVFINSVNAVRERAEKAERERDNEVLKKADWQRLAEENQTAALKFMNLLEAAERELAELRARLDTKAVTTSDNVTHRPGYKAWEAASPTAPEEE